MLAYLLKCCYSVHLMMISLWFSCSILFYCACYVKFVRCVFILLPRHHHAYACRARYCYGKSVLSVCLSVTHPYCIETNGHIVKLFAQSGRGKTVLFEVYHVFKIPRETSSTEVLNTREVEKNCDFRQKSPLSSERVRDGPVVIMDH